MSDDQQIDNKPSKVPLDKDDLVKALKTVYDPEIPVDIYELGLIYDVSLKESGNVDVKMTLTAPGCPVAGEMPQWVENALMSLEGVDMSLALELNQKGITDREELAEQSVDELIQLVDMTEEKAAKLIMQARAHWFE